MYSFSEINVPLISGGSHSCSLSKQFRYTLYRGRTTSTAFIIFLNSFGRISRAVSFFSIFISQFPYRLTARTHARTHIHTRALALARAHLVYIEACNTSTHFSAVAVLMFCDARVCGIRQLWLRVETVLLLVMFSVTTKTTSVAWCKAGNYWASLALLISLVCSCDLGS